MNSSTPPLPQLKQVLMVDDDAGNILVMAQALGNRYDLRFATSGHEALELIEQCLPDLILLDMVMPEMDGLQVLMTLRKDEKKRRIPVLFVTAYNDATSQAKAMEAGAAEMIFKPFDPQSLRSKVATYLNKSQA